MNYDFFGISKEFLKKGADSKTSFSWILLASLFAALLGLASSIYAIQIFNRYIGYGLDGTLWTLTVGALVAIVLEFSLKSVRYRLTSSMLTPKAAGEFSALATGVNALEYSAIAAKPANYAFEQIKAQQQLHNLYTPANFLTVVDTPFSLLFVLCIFLLAPTVGLLVAAVCVICVALGQWHRHRLRSLIASSNEGQKRLDESLINSIQLETIRAFNFNPIMEKQRRERLILYYKARTAVAAEQNQQNSQLALLTALTTVLVIGTGAVLVTQGSMDIGSLIGVNILAARAVGLINAAGRLSQSFEAAQSLENQLAEMEQHPRERTRGITIPDYSGRVVLKGLTHGHDPRIGPLFSEMNLDVGPGSVVLICGNNGSGKTSLARILAGLVEPQQGQVLVDGIDLLQISRSEWHRKLSYVPQEPDFLGLSLRDNLLPLKPDLNDDELRDILRRCGCTEIVDHHPDGLDQMINNSGKNFAPGLRKRLALARALASNGKVVLLDEVHSGLDPEGLRILMAVLQEMMDAKKTIFLCSHDRSIIKSGATVIDLNSKPHPAIFKV